jgi:DNA-binding transcriptional ArsR family regulator
MSNSTRKSLSDLRLDLIWGAWAELGASGWGRTHSEWAIDPEPLILHTAALGDADPRLRDEATDWCIRYWRFVSRVRLRNLLREASTDARSSFGELAATVNAHAGVTWPGATQARPYRVTGRSNVPSLQEPSLVWLRLRSMFGLGARTEILRQFLSVEGGVYSVTNLAELIGYAKRNVAEECDTLERAGVLSVKRVANRFYYSLARRSELSAFVGDQPPVLPPWPALLRVVDRVVDLDVSADKVSERVLAVEARKARDEMGSDLDLLGVGRPPEGPRGSSVWPSMKPWARQLATDWAKGRWPAESLSGLRAPLRSDR